MASSSSGVETGDDLMASRTPAALRKQLGDDATFGLIELLDTERKDWSEQVLSVATDRFERRLTEEVSALRVDLSKELHEGLNSVRQEIATTRVDMLKWSFVFWIGQVVAMAGLMSFMLRGAGR
jgi:hypothetical protein